MRTPQAGFTDTPGEGRMDEFLTHSRRGKTKFNAPSHPNRATKQLIPRHEGAGPPPTQGGGSGLSYHTFVEGRGKSKRAAVIRP